MIICSTCCIEEENKKKQKKEKQNLIDTLFFSITLNHPQLTLSYRNMIHWTKNHPKDETMKRYCHAYLECNWRTTIACYSLHVSMNRTNCWMRAVEVCAAMVQQANQRYHPNYQSIWSHYKHSWHVGIQMKYTYSNRVKFFSSALFIQLVQMTKKKKNIQYSNINLCIALIKFLFLLQWFLLTALIYLHMYI